MFRVKTQVFHATQCAACGAGASATEESAKGEALGTNLSILVLLSLIYGLGGIIVFKVVRMMKREGDHHR
jgi:hypothetical protein